MKKVWIPYLNTLHNYAIFFVVLVHCSPSAAARPVFQLTLAKILISFLMPLFVIISGFLFYYSSIDKRRTFSTFLVGKTRRLLLPYLLVSTVAFFPKSILSQYSVRSIEFSLSGYWHSLVFPFDNPVIYLWFIPVLFILYIPAFWMLRYVSRLPIGWNLLILVLLLVLYRFNPVDTKLLAIGRAVDYLGFFYAGMLTAKYHFILNKLQRWWVLVPALVILIILNLNPDPFLSVRAYRLLTTVFGVVLSFALAMNIAETKWDVFRVMGHYSYQVYILSWFFQVGFRLFYQLEILGYWATFSAMLLGGVLGPVVISRLVVRYLPRLKPAIGL